MTSKKNLYEILNVQPASSTEEIKAGFRKLAQIHHPDKNNNSSESQVNFQIIYNAYNTLISIKKREEYDAYLKTSSVIKNNSKYNFKEPKSGMDIVSKNNSLEYICTQFNFILWEIEDILHITKKSNDENLYSGMTINQWLSKILDFIDKWVLAPSGFVDYFYEVRKLKNEKPSNFLGENFELENHQPYANINDYFYDIRKRMNRFIDKINMQDVMKEIDVYKIKIIDGIIESQMLSYHYLGYLNLIIYKRISSVNKFIHSNKCFEDEPKEFIDYEK